MRFLLLSLLLFAFLPVAPVRANGEGEASFQDVMRARQKMIDAQNRGDIDGMEQAKREYDEVRSRYHGPGGTPRPEPEDEGPSLWESIKSFFGFGSEKKESVTDMIRRRNEQIEHQTDSDFGESAGFAPPRTPAPAVGPEVKDTPQGDVQPETDESHVEP